MHIKQHTVQEPNQKSRNYSYFAKLNQKMQFSVKPNRKLNQSNFFQPHTPNPDNLCHSVILWL